MAEQATKLAAVAPQSDTDKRAHARRRSRRMRDYVSGSMMPLVSRCRAAGALPRVEHTSEGKNAGGSAIHEHACDRVVYGISGAVERLDVVAAKWGLDEKETSIFRARAIACDYAPPAGAFPETALVLCADGRVERTAGGRGSYPDLPPDAVLPLQLDVMWSEPRPLYLEDGRVRCHPDSLLWVADIKAGRDAYVDPVETNWQLISETVLAARWTGAKAAIPAIFYWGKGPGTWDVPDAPMSAAGLDAAEVEIRRIIAEVDEQRRRFRQWQLHERLAAAEPMTFTTGGQCEFCGSAAFCPAKLAPLKRWLDDDAPLAPTGLTDAQARRLAVLQPQLAAIAAQGSAALKAYTAEHGSIPLGNGKAWGRYVENRSELIADITIPILSEEVGPELAAAARESTVSKAAVEIAVKTAHTRAGISRQLSAAMRRIFGKVRAAGGLHEFGFVMHGLHAVKEPEPPLLMQSSAPIEIDGDLD